MSSPTPDLTLRPISWASKTLGVSSDTIRRMISRGELTGYKVGRSIRLNEADVYAVIHRIPAAADTTGGDRHLGLRGGGIA